MPICDLPTCPFVLYLHAHMSFTYMPICHLPTCPLTQAQPLPTFPFVFYQHDHLPSTDTPICLTCKVLFGAQAVLALQLQRAPSDSDTTWYHACAAWLGGIEAEAHTCRGGKESAHYACVHARAWHSAAKIAHTCKGCPLLSVI